ncbi:MAG: DMT family transporter [Kiritimatiellae bacterium]|nr:DMT family transporter [Kiritimatiellia bacterium]
MSPSRRDLFLGCHCAVACEAVFGASYLFTKDATLVASPLALLGWRFAVAFASLSLLAAAGAVKVSPPRGRPVRRLVAVALASPVLYFTGETWGIARTTASESGAFLSVIPVACLVASSLLLGKRPTGRQVAGIAVTLAGVLATVFAASRAVSFSVAGYAFLALAVAGYALYSVFVEKAAAFTGAEIALAMLGAGAAVFAPLALAEAARDGGVSALLLLPLDSPAFLRAVLFQGVCVSVAGFILSNIAIAKLGVNRTASFIGVATAVAIVSGVVFLHESFPLAQLVGVALILLGVFLANRRCEPL